MDKMSCQVSAQSFNLPNTTQNKMIEARKEINNTVLYIVKLCFCPVLIHNHWGLWQAEVLTAVIYCAACE